MDATRDMEMAVTRPGISPETLARAGVRRLAAVEAKAVCGLAEAGLIIPYFDLDGSPIVDGGRAYGRLRLASPAGGKKYHQAFGTGVHAYLPPGLAANGPGGDLVLIEGEFKALALAEEDIAAVGLSGFFGFAIKGGEMVVPELADVLSRLRPDRILFCGDSDTALNFQFSVAALRLAALLAPLPVALPRISLVAPGKGVDDCRAVLLATFGGWWLSRVEEAVELRPGLTAGQLAVELLRLEGEAVSSLGGEKRDWAERRLVEMAACLEKEPLAQERVIEVAVERLKVGRAAFKRTMKLALDRLADEASMRGPVEDGTDEATSGPPMVNLSAPNGVWPKQVFRTIADLVYCFGGNVCRDVGGRFVPQLPAEMCSFVDVPERVRFVRMNSQGRTGPAQFGEVQGRILLGAWQDSTDVLRVVDVRSNVGVLAWDGSGPVLVNGYNRDLRILAGGAAVELAAVEAAVERVCGLLRDYDFATPGDTGRAIAFLLTPALAQGGFLGEGRVPLFFVKKDFREAGGSLLIRLVCHIYGLKPLPVTQIEEPKRAYEDVSSRLLEGDGLCYFDNARGNGLQKLPWFESLLTEPTFTCRKPYQMGVVDVRRRVFAVSTNGALLSDDLASRAVQVTIRKRPAGYGWFNWPEGGIEEHVVANRETYLAAAYALVDAWARADRPPGAGLSGFRFPQWERACAWILERHFPDLPLLDQNHAQARREMVDPEHDLLESLFRVVLTGEMRSELSASALAEIGHDAGLLPDGGQTDLFRLGKALKRRFPDDGQYPFGGGAFMVSRATRRSEAGKDVPFYTITQGGTA